MVLFSITTPKRVRFVALSREIHVRALLTSKKKDHEMAVGFVLIIWLCCCLCTRKWSL